MQDKVGFNTLVLVEMDDKMHTLKEIDELESSEKILSRIKRRVKSDPPRLFGGVQFSDVAMDWHKYFMARLRDELAPLREDNDSGTQ